ncbi:MAG: phosphoenolpyruvate--protein phosphotransferase [Candidatus Riflebacteria bacterium]|nr:phosphoenolpyruvate--protein phosphotransferase [Candidatus Riflebacteria bacterium]
MPDGLIASDGIAIGRAFILNEELRIPDYAIRESDVKLELLKFDAALAVARDQLVDLKERNKDHEATAKILEGQLLILVDPLFVGEVIQKVRSEKRNVEKIVHDVMTEFARSFSSMDNAYLKERAIDVQDVGRRILRSLLGQELQSLDRIPPDTVLVCHMLTPTDVARMDVTRVAGLCCEVGGITSHAAILARSLMIPALMGVENVTRQVKNGDRLVVDCIQGRLRVNPGPDEITEYVELQRQINLSRQRMLEPGSFAPVSKDGVRFVLRANISVPAEIASLATFGADGVGLFRTEYLYLKANSLPPQEEQFEAYKRVAEGCAPAKATIRTLDIGGDKEVPYLGIPPEPNPALGWRSIRFCLQNADVFKTQLRAILRASAKRNVRIMYPMITSPEEVRQANQYLDEVKSELRAKRVDFDPDVQVGVMIEVPAAALLADKIAPQVKFFSIGTNDLFQFTLAVDRSSQRLATMFDMLSLAMLRLIRSVVEQAEKAGVEVGCCGELAANPVGFLALLGLGIREFSMNVFSIPRIKQMLRSVDVRQVTSLVRQAVEAGSESALRDGLEKYLEATMGQTSAAQAPALKAASNDAARPLAPPPPSEQPPPAIETHQPRAPPSNGDDTGNSSGSGHPEASRPPALVPPRTALSDGFAKGLPGTAAAEKALPPDASAAGLLPDRKPV